MFFFHILQKERNYKHFEQRRHGNHLTDDSWTEARQGRGEEGREEEGGRGIPLHQLTAPITLAASL